MFSDMPRPIAGKEINRIIKTIWTNTSTGSYTNTPIVCDEDFSNYDFIIIDTIQQSNFQNNICSMIIPMVDFLDSTNSFTINTNYAGGQFSRTFAIGSSTNTVNIASYDGQYVLIPKTIRVI